MLLGVVTCCIWKIMTKTYLLPACYVLLRAFKLENSGQSTKEFKVLPSEPISKNISNNRALSFALTSASGVET